MSEEGNLLVVFSAMVNGNDKLATGFFAARRALQWRTNTPSIATSKRGLEFREYPVKKNCANLKARLEFTEQPAAQI